MHRKDGNTLGQMVLVKSSLLAEPSIGTLEESISWHPAYDAPAVRVNFPNLVALNNRSYRARSGWFKINEVSIIEEDIDSN